MFYAPNNPISSHHFQLQGCTKFWNTCLLACFLSQHGFLKEAKDLYESYLKEHPKKRGAWLAIADIYQIFKQFGESLFARLTAWELELFLEERGLIFVKDGPGVDDLFSACIKTLPLETKKFKDRLSYFVSGVSCLQEYKPGQVPIKSENFSEFMKTNEEEAQLIKSRCLEKGYLFDTRKKTDKGVKIFIVNPYLEKTLKQWMQIQVVRL